MKKLYLHIGTHKTGSTSLQKFLHDKSSRLSTANMAFYEGMFEKDNHIELHVAAMRPDRRSFSKDKYNLQGTPELQNKVRNRVAAFQEANKDKNLIFTTEGLYMLRHDDEIDTLKGILSSEKFQILVILATRNKQEFLESMRTQIKKVPSRNVSSDPASHLYVEPDSWLARYDEVEALWRAHFGDESLRIVDYDLARTTGNGNVLPVMLEALDIPESLQSGCEEYFHNTRTQWSRLKQSVYAWMCR